MTNKELIEELRKYPEDEEVVVSYGKPSYDTWVIGGIESVNRELVRARSFMEWHEIVIQMSGD